MRLFSRLFLLATALTVNARAQSSNNEPIVEAEEVVVKGNAPSVRAAAGKTDAAVDGSLPVLMGSWDDITSQVPNLGVLAAGPSSFGSIFTLRGLSNTPYFSEPAVTLYFDNIPLGGSFSYPTDLFGIARASVFSGPQPTAFGRAGDGGVITLIPTSSQGGGEVRAGIGSFDSRSAALVAGGPEGSRGDFDVAAGYAQRSGYIENTQINQPVDDMRALTAFAKERYRPTSLSEISLEILADRHRDGAAPLVPLDGPLYSVERSHEGETDSELFGGALTWTLDAGGAKIASTTSFTTWKLDPYADWLVVPPVIQSYLTQSQEAWNEELRVSSALRPWVSWDAGAWLSDGSTAGASDRNINGVYPFDMSDFGYTRHDEALFGEVALSPTHLWQISIGGRLQQVEKTYHQDEQVPTSGLHLHFIRTDGSFLPKMAATRSLGDKATANASITFGTRPGGFSAYTDKPSLIPFSSESTAAFQGGFECSLAGRTLVLATRAFDYEIRNYQIERSFSPTDYFVTTAPRARSLGAESDLTWTPSRAWTIEASAGLTSATLLQFHDPLTGVSFDGNRAPYAPASTLGLNVEYRSPAGWFAAAGGSETGRTFYTESENPIYSQSAYALINARIGLDEAWWRVTLFVTNAAAKGYYAAVIPGVNSASPGIPRTLGAEMALKFR